MQIRSRFWPAALALVTALGVQTWAQTQPARPIPPTPLASPATQPAAATQPAIPPAVQTQPATPPAAQPATRAASPVPTPSAAGEKPAAPAVGQPAAKRQAESPAKHEGNAPAKRAGEAPAEPKKAVYSGEPQKPAVAEHKPPAEKDAAAEAAPEAPGGGLDFMSMVFVFMLATFIGIGVIRRVSRLLHTPLMSLTNAISAIAVVGSLMLAGGKEYPLGYKIIGAVAMFASMTNIISGFLITDRMLKMFKTRQGGKA